MEGIEREMYQQLLDTWIYAMAQNSNLIALMDKT